ncbi:MAG: sigma-70 family RNA polymerase sigma factor [candidate division WOR-3 bacterium]
MPQIDGEQLKAALVQAQESLEGIRTLTEAFIRHRIREYRQGESIEEDDITEKVFQQLARALCSYDKDRAANPFAWFMTVVDHRIIDYCRQHKIPIASLDEPRQSRDQDKEEREPSEPADTVSPTPSSMHRQMEAHEVLIEAMSRLSSPARREMLLIVTLFPELSYEEIVKITHHVSVDAAKECKSRTMKEMRKHLADMGYDPAMFGALLRGE